MRVNSPGQMGSDVRQGGPAGRFLGRLRDAALIAAYAGAAGSLALMLVAGQHPPTFLLVIFAFWVAAPFALFMLADIASKRWSLRTRATLYVAMLVVTLGSLAVYADDARGHRRPQAAFVYVAVPPASVLLGAIAVAIAALISGNRSRRGA
ncbi:MAG: hypothetical protein M3081_08555 [Gemmatimonadota bacterium]|nr:hypothetical protein [Gemmatimonadota bacterium]